jgi:diacylglycerol kinase (ATP)
MRSPTPRVTLIHNPGAGGGTSDRQSLVAMIERAGYAVTVVDAKDDDIAAALAAPADLIATAGGDGTVRRVAMVARPDGPPIAILPLGRANNIAKSLRIAGPLQTLIDGWRVGRLKTFFPIAAETPWGRQRLVEGLGFGVLAQAIEELRGTKIAAEAARRHVAGLVLRAEPQPLDVRLDAETHSGSFLVFEVMTIPFVGPNLILAPTADPANDLDVCYAGGSPEERRQFSAWLAQPGAVAPAPVATRTARCVSVSGRLNRIRLDDNVRLDDGATSGTIVLMPEERPLCFVVPEAR